MSCSNDTAQDGLAAEQRQRLKAGFAQMWPANSPFPPAMPWLAAVVGRGEAWAWVVSLARQDGSIRLDSPVQALDFVGRAMTGGGVYATQRRESKRDARIRRATERELDRAVEDAPDQAPSRDERHCPLYTCSGCGSSMCCYEQCEGEPPGPCNPCARV